ncbi:DUF1657 domain-containing protein [Paenibacillus macerans]|uniref:DUF1657 domain-containing protein n=1 Tax=Paenibacillus macerans TaxID=44252 RepID=UPI003D32194B
MTVIQKVRQAISSLTGVQASLQTFAIQSQDPQAKESFKKGAEETRLIITNLEHRVKQMEEEEPQYKPP